MSYLFYCTHNQLCVPQYKVNVWSTWYIYNFAKKVDVFANFSVLIIKVLYQEYANRYLGVAKHFMSIN